MSQPDTPSVSLAGIAELLRKHATHMNATGDEYAAADYAARLAGVLETAPVDDGDDLTGYRIACVEFVERLREFAATPTEEKADR